MPKRLKLPHGLEVPRQVPIAGLRGDVRCCFLNTESPDGSRKYAGWILLVASGCYFLLFLPPILHPYPNVMSMCGHFGKCFQGLFVGSVCRSGLGLTSERTEAVASSASCLSHYFRTAERPLLMRGQAACCCVDTIASVTDVLCLVFRQTTSIFSGIYRSDIIAHPKKPDVESAVLFLIKMVDRQFMHQNGMVIPSPSPFTPTPEPKWVSPDITEKHGTYKRILRSDHLSMMDRLMIFLAEFLGTAILVFLGCAGCVKFREGSGPSALEVAFAFGMAILIAVQCVGHISGAHINPVVTVAALIMGVTPLIQVPLYLGGQFLGSLTGYGLLKALVPQEYIKRSQDNVSLCSPEPNPKLQDTQVVFIEFLMTLFLVFIICSAWDSRNSSKLDSFSIKLGLAIVGLGLVGGGFTGAHLNPARTFGPALINGDWGYHWMYWVAPLSASVVGTISYQMVFQKPLKKSEGETNGNITPANST